MKRYNFKKVLLKDDILDNGYIVTDNGKIIEIGINKDNNFDGDMAIAGIFDIHSHGSHGFSATTTSKEDILSYTKAIASTGVTSVLATTQELDSLSLIADIIDKDERQGARIIGINAEGPFRNEKYMGASKGFLWPEPSIEYSKRMLESARGHLLYMSVSSELEKMDEIIPYLVKNGVKVAGGHTDATFKEMNEGIKLGVSSISHFGNAMRKIHQREGGAIVACLLNDDIYLEINPDHVHLSKEIMDLFFKVRGMGKYILISDSSEVAGMPKGTYFARGKKRFVNEEGDVTTDDGTISGSGHPIIYGIRKLILEDNYNPVDVVNMATLNPCKYMGIDDKKGSIEVGKDADIVILGNNYQVKKTIVEGETVFDIDDNEILFNQAMKNLCTD